MDTKALRQKILDLAIRGKLVPQDPNDEPASVLLERIRAQKQQMVREGKLKSKDIKDDTVIFVGEDNLHYEKLPDGSVKCIEDEIPFDLPDGWVWGRLTTLLDIFITGPFGSSLHKSDYVENGIPLINPMNIVDGEIIPIDKMQISNETVERLASFKVIPNDIVIARRGDMGRCAVVHYTQTGWLCGTGSFVLRLSTFLWPEYFAACIRSPYAVTYLSGNSIGNTMLNLNQTILKNLLLPVPPFKEQKRIIDGINNADAYLKQLSDEREHLIATVAKTKSKILDLAIRGQLVPQNPSDEPASVLLDRIRIEKEELIRQGKLKRDKKESVIFRGDDNSYYLKQGDHVEAVDSQFLFDLPDGWSWCLLPNISHSELGKTLDQAKNTGDLHPYLRSVNIRWDEVDLSDVNQMRFEPEEMDRYTITKGDLLICEGGDVGRSAIWISDNDILYQNALHRVRFWGGINPRFFMYYMMFYESKGIIKDICKGVTIKHLTGNVLNSIPFALPPVDEQIAIVAKIDEAFKLLNTIL